MGGSFASGLCESFRSMLWGRFLIAGSVVSVMMGESQRWCRCGT